MPDLRRRKLTDRTPVKMRISVPPELSEALGAYAALYRETYGEAEPVAGTAPGDADKLSRE